MALITKPNTFSASTAAVASEVNDNFDEIYDEFNGNINSANIATSGVATANIAADAVTNAKIADGAIYPEQLIASTGTSWAWQSYTPTWTNITVGNATQASKYLQVGKTVFVRLQLTLGSTSTVDGTPTVSLPVTAVSHVANSPIGTILLDDVSGNSFPAIARYASTTTASLAHMDIDGSSKVNYAVTNATTPFTWTTSDTITGTLIYEAA